MSKRKRKPKENDWNEHDTELALELVLEGMRRKKLKKGEGRRTLSYEEKRHVLEQLDYKKRDINGLKFKMYNLVSALLYVVRYGQNAVKQQLKARIAGEEEQYVGKQRVRRGFLHSSTMDYQVVLKFIETGKLDVAVLLTNASPSNTHGKAESLPTPKYREVIAALVSSVENLLTPSLITPDRHFAEIDAAKEAVRMGNEILASVGYYKETKNDEGDQGVSNK